MAFLETKLGNLLEATEVIIGHQTNCKGVMGRGVAAAIKAKYPKAFKEYQNLCNTYGEDCLGEAQFVPIDDNRIVVNIFGQNTYGNGLHKNYEALKEGLISMIQKAKALKYDTITLPSGIGCRFGAKLDYVFRMIRSLMEEFDINIVLYKLGS